VCLKSIHLFFLTLLTFTLTISQANAASLASVKTVPGNAVDRTNLNGGMGSANVNRLGGFFSDVYYDRFENVYYGLVDRGPGGGTIGYDDRVQKFTLDINPVTGAASNLKVIKTIQFTIPAGKTVNGITGPASFNGLDPFLDPLNGDPTNLGRSFDPEGFAVAPNGNFYVSDEYGPSVFEFSPSGVFIRAFTTPGNLLPKDAAGVANFSAVTGTVATGRVANRGFEGLAISPDGSKLYAILQDPMTEDGSPTGRFSRNLRIVVYDTLTGTSNTQFAYQLEPLADINTRVPNNPFNANAQGNSIGVSSITSINDHEFLVLERDNRGLGVTDAGGNTPVASKRIYRIDINGASNVANTSFAGSNDLPADVIPVQKKLYIDILASLLGAGFKGPEKIEGIAIGPQLKDGSFALISGTDNDFSVTQDGVGTQFDVCSDGTQVPIDSGCPAGTALIPTFYFSFKSAGSEITIASPIQQLIDAVTGLRLQPGVSTLLKGTLADAQTQASRGKKVAAQLLLDVFAVEVAVLSPRSIPTNGAIRLLEGTVVAKLALR
jgi:hypothetical protein